MYYSAYDLQCNCYFESGRNSRTKRECKEDVIAMLDEEGEFNYLGDDIYRDGQTLNTLTGDEVLSIYQVEIHKHKVQI